MTWHTTARSSRRHYEQPGSRLVEALNRRAAALDELTTTLRQLHHQASSAGASRAGAGAADAAGTPDSHGIIPARGAIIRGAETVIPRHHGYGWPARFRWSATYGHPRMIIPDPKEPDHGNERSQTTPGQRGTRPVYPGNTPS